MKVFVWNAQHRLAKALIKKSLLYKLMAKPKKKIKGRTPKMILMKIIRIQLNTYLDNLVHRIYIVKLMMMMMMITTTLRVFQIFVTVACNQKGSLVLKAANLVSCCSLTTIAGALL